MRLAEASPSGFGARRVSFASYQDLNWQETTPLLGFSSLGVFLSMRGVPENSSSHELGRQALENLLIGSSEYCSTPSQIELL